MADTMDIDWYAMAEQDYKVYGDPSRIADYVQFGKITETEYEEITGQPYEGGTT